MLYRRCLLAGIFFILFFFLSISSLDARGGVNGKYLHSRGQEIVLELSIGTPAPASLILKQQLPAGTRIIHADPPVKKYTPKNGKARWLFTDLKPGIMIIRLQLAESLHGKPPAAEIRCKDPETGKYVTTRIP